MFTENSLALLKTVKNVKVQPSKSFPVYVIQLQNFNFICTTQVSLYAVEKFALTNFLLENTKLYDDLFIEKDILYTLDDVYKEIDHVANTVGSL